MQLERATKIIDAFTKDGISQGFSGRPLKRFIERKIKKNIKRLKKKCKRLEGGMRGL